MNCFMLVRIMVEEPRNSEHKVRMGPGCAAAPFNHKHVFLKCIWNNSIFFFDLPAIWDDTFGFGRQAGFKTFIFTANFDLL